MFAEIVQNFVEVALVVVNNCPSATPSRDAENLTQGSRAHHWHGFGHVAERVERSFLVVAQPVVNLIRNDGYSVFVCDSKNFLNMLLREARAAGV
jgi:hypothetical protein